MPKRALDVVLMRSHDVIYTRESGNHFHSIVKDRLEKRANGKKRVILWGKK